MDDVVLAAFDYGKLDRDGQSTRIRLEFHLRRRPQRRRHRAPELRARRCAPSGRGKARGARLFPYGHPPHHAGAAGAAARGAGVERQGAAGLHQRARPRLASMGGAPRARHFRAHVVSQPGEARLSREPRRLSPRARPVRARLPAPGPRSGRSQPGARCPHAVSHRPGEAARHDVCGFRDAHPRRARPHARRGRICERAATLRRSPSIAGRTATATWRTRCSTATTTTRCWRGRGKSSGASPSPRPTPPATPMPISPSIRPPARCASSWGDTNAGAGFAAACRPIQSLAIAPHFRKRRRCPPAMPGRRACLRSLPSI